METEKLETVPIREVWPDERRDFNRWLGDNIELLNESLELDIPLVPTDTEFPAGDFSADVLIEDKSGERVVIECQLSDSDHKHLGQLLTYLTNLEAKTAIWICTNPRPEHVTAISWLNEVSAVDVSFYLVKVQVVRIGDSAPAPLFTTISAPSEETKESGRAKERNARYHKLRNKFWTKLLEKSESTPNHLFRGISPGKMDYIQKSAGWAGITYKYTATYDYVSVDLYIDTKSPEDNRRILDSLRGSKKEIEEKFGSSLEWDHKEGRRACIVRWKREGVGLEDEDKWPEIQDELIETMSRFHDAINAELNETMQNILV
ncbi:MAG: DUF4268 domain-containing protein [Candidatus Thorarchaeota archaeon]